MEQLLMYYYYIDQYIKQVYELAIMLGMNRLVKGWYLNFIFE